MMSIFRQFEQVEDEHSTEQDIKNSVEQTLQEIK